MPLFERVLVANRGEIAHRIFRTCRQLGIATVAIAPDDDRDSLHARSADAVARVSSYLAADDIVAAARSTGAAAVHPCYGFLSEQADFARAVEAAGLVWIGPPPSALSLAGDKLEAREVAARSGVPTLASGDPIEVGYPLIVKAAAGGGGRGMRVVREPGELDAAVEAAKREAQAAFGDDRVYFESFVESARHVEVQLLADSHGEILALGERDCSLQRRHQKLIEESPSPVLAQSQREQLAIYATTLARQVGYQNAGTAEFLVAPDGAISFIELNARLQVEHPVTELVWGVDLVEWQLKIAAGAHLDLRPEPHGHAIEVRVYAEHPVTFLPEIGTIRELELPGDVRGDAAVESGDQVSTRYDAMVAKLVAHGPDRASALARLERALAETRVGGVVTNVALLRWLVEHESFRDGQASTDFFELHPPLERAREAPAPWPGYFRLGRDPNEAPPRATAPPSVDRASSTGAVALGDATAALVVAPMPGTVLEVFAEAGQEVSAREPLLVLEAMKMETPVTAPFAGRVASIGVSAGEQVAAGDVLAELSS
ncbi:MAG: acetyl/propionyl/methylcrotonyl-CoA carboxylase subunit alpha [Gaiellaceae bacterium]